MKQGIVTLIIYFYIFVCSVFLLFNILYIFYDKYVEKRHQRYVEQFKKYIYEAVRSDNLKHERFIKRELRDFQKLYSYYYALKDCDDIRNQYLVKYHISVVELFKYYIKRDNIEQAFIANMIDELFGDCRDTYRELPVILIHYLDDSTVYVRENVLKALCTLGSVKGIEMLFNVFNERHITHNTKLLSDGLNSFNGDKREMAYRLFTHYDEYEGELNISIINFMSTIGNEFSDELIRVFDKSDNECKHAIMRYFRKYPDERFRDIMIDILNHNDNLSITAAFALGTYHDLAVKNALKKSLKSSNWYIRKNSAEALLQIGLDDDEITKLKNNEDRYASEIFNYVLESKVN